jgi:fluoroquinolone transport system permease protein
MKRLLAAARFDWTLQWRNGFYAVTVGAALLIALTVRQLAPAELIPFALPYLFLLGLTMPFYFAAGQVLFEKSEGTLDAMRVSPLRIGEYLLSKTVTVSLIGLSEGLLMSLICVGLDFHGPLFLLGGFLMAAVYTLSGLWLVVRYDSMAGFLMPSVLATILLELPVFLAFEAPVAQALLVWPNVAALTLLQAAFDQETVMPLTAGVFAALAWLMILGRACYRAFQKRIVAGEPGWR